MVNRVLNIKEPSILYIWLIFLFPTFWGYSNGSNTFGQLLLSVSLFTFVVVCSFIKTMNFPFIKSYFYIFTIQLFCYITTLSIRSIDNGNTISLSDYSDIVRPILYLVAVCAPIALEIRDTEVKRIARTIVFGALLIALFDLTKYVPFGQNILKLYTPLAPNSFNYLRFSGTFAYCYNYGFVLLFALLYGLYAFKYKFLWGSLIIILIFLTGSRAIFIGCFTGLLIYFLTLPKSCFFKAFVLILLSGGVVGLYHILTLIEVPIVQDIIANVDKLLSVADEGVSSDGSAATRNNQLELAYNNFIKNPLLGNGPLKESTAPIEIQLGYYLSSWGAIGAIIFLSTSILALYYAVKSLKSEKNEYQAFTKANIIWILTSFIAGISTPITDQVRVFQLFYLVQGTQFYIYSICKAKRSICTKAKSVNTETCQCI